MAEAITIKDTEFCPSGQTTAQDLARMSSGKALGADALTPYVQTKSGGEKSLDLMISGAHCSGCMAKMRNRRPARHCSGPDEFIDHAPKRTMARQ